MPASTEKQARTMRACGHGANYPVCKKLKSSMGVKKMREFYHTAMPKGASQSPSGDIGVHRVKEAGKVVPVKNWGDGEASSRYFGSRVAEPGKVGEK